MKKILLAILVFTSLQADIFPIGHKIIIEKVDFIIDYIYQDYCDNGYVWRRFEGFRQGSYAQVFIKEKSSYGYFTSVPKTCGK